MNFSKFHNYFVGQSWARICCLWFPTASTKTAPRWTLPTEELIHMYFDWVFGAKMLSGRRVHSIFEVHLNDKIWVFTSPRNFPIHKQQCSPAFSLIYVLPDHLMFLSKCQPDFAYFMCMFRLVRVFPFPLFSTKINLPKLNLLRWFCQNGESMKALHPSKFWLEPSTHKYRSRLNGDRSLEWAGGVNSSPPDIWGHFFLATRSRLQFGHGSIFFFRLQFPFFRQWNSIGLCLGVPGWTSELWNQKQFMAV